MLNINILYRQVIHLTANPQGLALLHKHVFGISKKSQINSYKHHLQFIINKNHQWYYTAALSVLRVLPGITETAFFYCQREEYHF